MATPIPYKMAPPPINSDPELRRYLVQELGRIEAALKSLKAALPPS